MHLEVQLEDGPASSSMRSFFVLKHAVISSLKAKKTIHKSKKFSLNDCRLEIGIEKEVSSSLQRPFIMSWQGCQ